ncbi:MAG: F0F1 ATP synthase subunit A [Nitrospirae bacterium]|nr:F0F1 ATP synthase subunit A [Nitrospirota bacterium]
MEAANSAHGGGAPEVANIITLLNSYFHESSIVSFLHHWENPVFSVIIITGLVIVARMAARKRALIPGKLQNFVEFALESLDNLSNEVIGHHGRHYAPFIGTLFIYILVMNLSGLIPFFKSPSSSLNTTIGLAVIVFIYVQYTGLRRLGPGGYIFHLLGQPRDVMGWVFVPLMLPLHVIEEFIKPMSLSLRLFGNVFGEDVLIGAFVTMGILALSFVGSPIGIPLQIPFMLLAIITGTIQALVFTLLSTVYISLMLPHEEH